MAKILFLDIPSKDGKGSWSPNTWKTRLALNFKGLDYETQWVEYPDIASTLSSHVEANPVKNKSDKAYQLPAVKLPDGTWIMDSKKIAQRLEKDQPVPSLKLDDPVLPEVERLFRKIMGPLVAVWLPHVPYNLLNEPSKEYFIRTREEDIGKPLKQFAQESGGEEAWIQALPALKELGDLLRKHDGPFLLGPDASYADLVVLGLLQFYKLIDEEIYQKAVKLEPALKTLFEAGQPLLKRSSH